MMDSIEELEVVAVPLDRLREHPDNPRTITDEALARLVKSLEEEPEMLRARPVVALPDGRIVAGNKRWLAAREIGRETIPAFIVDMDEDRARLWMLRDNNEYGEWVPEDLAKMLKELEEESVDLSLSGFDDDELADLLKLLDAPPETPGDQGDALAVLDVSLGAPEHVAVKGDVWMVGKHHLVVGNVYEDWGVFAPLLVEGDLLVPYPTPILPLTKRARENRLVMVQPDAYLAGHLLDKFASIHGAELVFKV